MAASMDQAARKTRASRPSKDVDERVRDRSEAAILEAAGELFARKGFDGVRIAEIAERSGLPKANVYYYFPSKEDIYKALIGKLLAGWDKALEELRADRKPAEALGAYIVAKLEYSRQFGSESRLFANEILRGGRFLSKANRDHMRAMTRDKAVVIESWIAAGKMSPISVRHVFIMLWGATQFYADFEVLACDALAIKRITKKDFDEAAATITAIVLRGCNVVESAAEARSTDT
ncbi:TetR family transcriptional regulator C-terminal domain-containing protein [Methylocapsa sp. S129]|uniref:TetR family transcriptional regulator C-terminal domain-containing protein n=1 Tax=Methylocapsa sp. S129 TaxID=1641869 RepID=UPI001FEF69F6|nr:TetR family transcriptional regulator C-terminal domain-containing protein [Methylocapsa sp. S129]